MSHRARHRLATAGAAVGIVVASCRREPPPSTAARSAVIVQPGPPGAESRVLTAATVGTPPPPDQVANTEFMQGMIQHHRQALQMVELLETRTESPAMKRLAQKIEISQTQEIQAMQTWLANRGRAAPVAMPNDAMRLDGASMPLMPGMLSPHQMAVLAAAKGRAFDRLFLTDMIQHHTGALTMVQHLFATAGAGQDSELFAFASDVDNSQRMDIARMQQMLGGMP